MARSLKNPGIQGSGVWHPNILLPHQISGWRGHRSPRLGHCCRYPLAEAATAEGWVQEPEGTEQHSFPAGHMPDGVHGPLRVPTLAHTLAVTPILL